MSELLTAYKDETLGCTRCPLASTRTQVVFGSGDANAEVMFVGEAPGYHEDQQGVPFVGQAGQLLEKLLNGIGLTRADVYIANVLKCRPPGNRDPQPEEIEACESHLFRQIELIRPTLVATLGNFATKLLSGKPTGITRVHGVPQQVTLGGNDVTLYPLYHPAAALYTRSMLGVLEQDFLRLPELLGRVSVPAGSPFAPEPESDPETKPAVEREHEPAVQLGLFYPWWSCARPRRARPRRSPHGSRQGSSPATSSRCRASSEPARRRSSAAPAARSA
jgi:uracil-DNA glycosylase